MLMQVNQELCAGCGVCMEACAVDAIHLVNQRAVIDAVLCTHCEACIDACPNGAITAIAEPARQAQLIALPDAKKANLPIPAPATTQEKVSTQRRLTAQATSATTSPGVSSTKPTRITRGIRKQARIRGSRNNYWKS